MSGKLRYDRTMLYRIRSALEGTEPPHGVPTAKDPSDQSWRRNNDNFRAGLRRNDASAGSLEEFRGDKHHLATHGAANGTGTGHGGERGGGETQWVYRTLGSTAVSAPTSWSDIQSLIDEQLVAREEVEVCRAGELNFVPYVSALAARTSRLAPQPVSIDDIEGLMSETRSPKKDLPRISSVDSVPVTQLLPQAILPPEPILPNGGFEKAANVNAHPPPPPPAQSSTPAALTADKVAPTPPPSLDAQPVQSKRQAKQAKAKAAPAPAPTKAVESAPPVMPSAQAATAPAAWGGKGVAPKQQKVDIEALIVEEKRAQEERSKQEEQDRLRAAAASDKGSKKKMTKGESESQKVLDKNFPALESIAVEGNSKRSRKG